MLIFTYHVLPLQIHRILYLLHTSPEGICTLQPHIALFFLKVQSFKGNSKIDKFKNYSLYEGTLV